MSEQLIKEDRETGLQLFSRHRREPGGEVVELYRFHAPRGLPEWLAPVDNADRAAAMRAFDEIAAHLKANPA